MKRLILCLMIASAHNGSYASPPSLSRITDTTEAVNKKRHDGNIAAYKPSPMQVVPKLFDVNMYALVHRADLYYSRPTNYFGEGLPIGNGVMGTLVWTDPGKIRYQVNRNDTYGEDRTHKHYDPAIVSGQKVETTNNILSLCRLAINVGNAVFNSQSQNTTDGTVRVNYAKDSLSVTNFVSANTDLQVVNIADKRSRPEEFVFEVSMVRQPNEVNGENHRNYTITETNGRIVIVQTVEENSFYMQYAVAIGAVGRTISVLEKTPAKIRFKTQAANSDFQLYLSTAATLYNRVDVSQQAINILTKAGTDGFAKIIGAHREWWRNFWKNSRTFVQLSSTDGVAEFLEACYNLHLYQMASSSRGTYPTHYNYSLWLSDSTGRRDWGAQFKYMNDMMFYFPLYAANMMELVDPYLNMYRNMLADLETAAKQRWGVTKGIFLPETLGPSGPVILSAQAAPMVNDVLMGRRTRASLPPSVILECEAEGTIDWINPKFTSIRKDRFTWVSHILSSGAQLAMQFYWRYEYTGDVNWLRNKAYPMMKGVVDFYHSYAKKEADGKYHISPANIHESYWGVKDGIVDLAAVRSLVPKVLACSEILGLDADKRAGWAEFLQNIAQYPAGNHPDVVQLQSPGQVPGAGESVPLFPPGTFGAGYALHTKGREKLDPVWLWPILPFEHVSLAKGRYTGTQEDKDNFQKMLLTYQNVPPTFYGFTWPNYPGRLGITSEVKRLLPLYTATVIQTPNGMQGAWGHANTGLMVEGIQGALLQSNDSLIIVTPSWPAEWKANFSLLARGGFLVSAVVENGKPQVLQVESTFGRDCRMVNPWFPAPAYLRRTGQPQQRLDAELLNISLQTGESFVMVADSAKTLSLPIVVNPSNSQVVKKLEVMKNGQKITRWLGK